MELYGRTKAVPETMLVYKDQDVLRVYLVECEKEISSIMMDII